MSDWILVVQKEVNENPFSPLLQILSIMLVRTSSISSSRSLSKYNVSSKSHQNDHFARTHSSSDGEKERSKQASLNDGLSKAQKLMMPTADSRIHSGLLEKKVT